MGVRTWSRVAAEVADQLDQLGADRSPARRAQAAEGVLVAAARRELDPDDPAFWQAVADALRGRPAPVRSGSPAGDAKRPSAPGRT